MDVPLQPLRIPTGWAVSYNDGLYEIDPSAEKIPANEHIGFFKEDMLQLRHAHLNRVLDVGWYPEGDLRRGEYKIVLHEGDFRGPQIHEFRGRDRLMLVVEIERLLHAVVEGLI